MNNRHDLIDDGLDEDLAFKMAQISCDLPNQDDGTENFPDTQGQETELEPTNCNDISLTLTDLPVEVLIHMASFLESRVIITSLYGVCKLFYELFSDDKYWKTRISQRWQKQYPVIESKFMCKMLNLSFMQTIREP